MFQRGDLKRWILVISLLIAGLIIWLLKSQATPPPLATVTLGPTNTALRIHASYGVLMVLPDGTLWAWGDPGMYSATPKRAVVPTQIGTNTDWKEAIAANHHCVALKQDGTLWEWGWRAGSGQRVVSLPEQVGTETNWIAIAAGNVHSLALKRDGTLWVWGDGTFDTLGIGKRTRVPEPVQIGTNSDWVAVTGGNLIQGIRRDGSLWVWGNSGSTIIPFPVQACREKDWASFSPNGFAVTKDGEVWNARRLSVSAGDADESRSKLFRPYFTKSPDDRGWAQAGLRVFEVRTNGTLWRRNVTINSSGSPSTIPDFSVGKARRFGDRSDWSSICGAGIAIGVTADGTIWTWGADVSRDPIPELSARIKMLENKVRKALGFTQKPLSYGSSFPITENPRPLLQMITPSPAAASSR